MEHSSKVNDAKSYEEYDNKIMADQIDVAEAVRFMSSNPDFKKWFVERRKEALLRLYSYVE